MPPHNEQSPADLTIRDIWDLLKTYFAYAVGCTLIFGLPYALLVGAGFGLSALGVDAKWWVNLIGWGVIALLIVTGLPDFLEDFGTFLVEMGRAARGASVAKRVVGLAFVAAYMFMWQWYATVALFFSTLVLLPWGFTLDRYKKLIREKAEADALPKEYSDEPEAPSEEV